MTAPFKRQTVPIPTEPDGQCDDARALFQLQGIDHQRGATVHAWQVGGKSGDAASHGQWRQAGRGTLPEPAQDRPAHGITAVPGHRNVFTTSRGSGIVEIRNAGDRGVGCLQQPSGPAQGGQGDLGEGDRGCLGVARQADEQRPAHATNRQKFAGADGHFQHVQRGILASQRIEDVILVAS